MILISDPAALLWVKQNWSYALYLGFSRFQDIWPKIISFARVEVYKMMCISTVASLNGVKTFTDTQSVSANKILPDPSLQSHDWSNQIWSERKRKCTRPVHPDVSIAAMDLWEEGYANRIDSVDHSGLTITSRDEMCSGFTSRVTQWFIFPMYRKNSGYVTVDVI